MTPEEKSARKAGKSLITRARRAAFTALDVYRQEVGANLDFDDDLTNLLTALHHLTDNHNLDWKELLWSAKRGYQEDRAHARKPKQVPPPALPVDQAWQANQEPRYSGVPGPDGVTQTIHEVLLTPIPPPTPGLHPAPFDGPRRADEIAWVRDYLVVHLNQADVPPKVQPNITELDGWAAQIVDHLVRVMIRPDGGGTRGMISLSEALAESQRAAENVASWEGAWPNPNLLAHQGDDGEDSFAAGEGEHE